MTREENLYWLNKEIETWENECQSKHPIKEALYAARRALEQESRWIPITERMPDEREWIGTKRFGTTISDEVYVTFKTLDGKLFCEHLRFQNGKLSPSAQIEVDAISKGAKPIAWMPLPKPYEPQESKGN